MAHNRKDGRQFLPRHLLSHRAKRKTRLARWVNGGGSSSPIQPHGAPCSHPTVIETIDEVRQLLHFLMKISRKIKREK